MISITEEISALKSQEQALYTSLDNLRGQGSKVKEHRQLDKELTGTIRKRQSYESLARLKVGMLVNRADSKSLGEVCALKIIPSGLAEVWVDWDGKGQLPEQPHLLQIDECALTQIVSVGDRIVTNSSHGQSGKTFTVARLLARGGVETTNELIFEREEWVLVENCTEVVASVGEELVGKENTPITLEIEMEEAESAIAVENLTTTFEVSELTQEEEQERHRLELKVERAFYEAGTALRQLRDRKLYRSSHRTFEAYCRDRFGFSRRHPYRLIDAATVIDSLCPIGTQTQESYKIASKQILPNSERQVRALVELEPEKQRQIWQQAVEESDGKVPSGRMVKGIVERLKEKPLFKASDFCCIGDVFTLTRLEGAERKYNGCWAIAFELRDFTIAVDIHDRTLTVKPDNLNPVDLPDVRRQLPETLKRIRRLRECNLLDRCAYTVLESLGRQIYLTDFEADLLIFMEQRYGIEK